MSDLNEKIRAGFSSPSFGKWIAEVRFVDMASETPLWESWLQKVWQRKRVFHLAPEGLYYAQARGVNASGNRKR
jgi:hypothetical protein